MTKFLIWEILQVGITIIWKKEFYKITSCIQKADLFIHSDALNSNQHRCVSSIFSVMLKQLAHLLLQSLWKTEVTVVQEKSGRGLLQTLSDSCGCCFLIPTCHRCLLAVPGRCAGDKRWEKGTAVKRSDVSELSELSSLLLWNADFSPSAGKTGVEAEASAAWTHHSLSVGTGLERLWKLAGNFFQRAMVLLILEHTVTQDPGPIPGNLFLMVCHNAVTESKTKGLV